jgi:hypothetical protein
VIADGTNRAVIITDRKLKIVYANATFAAMFRPHDRAGARAAGDRTAGGSPQPIAAP